MTTETSTVAAAPAWLLAALACPICKGSLACWDVGLACGACGRKFGRLAASEAPVLLPTRNFVYEPEGAARDIKSHVQDRFAMIDRSLPQPYGSFATFLNLGYVADASPQFATRGPTRPAFGRYCVKLLFEVLGACEIDGGFLVEMGCGRGGNLALIDRHYESTRLLGIDLCTANIDFCQQRHMLSNGGFAVGDVEYAPLRSACCDVVLNLESSHYYPDRARFFREVFRVLKPGGDFLYADILGAEEFRDAELSCRDAGFLSVLDRDISANVLLSCEEIAKIKEAQRSVGIYDTFLVVPGSLEFERLSRGETRYKILHYRKPGGKLS
jgi:SAM-dependent methyltransferase